MISGSYSPGDIYFFRGLGAGRFASGRKLCSADGKPANAGRASSVATVDWDRDGDLDLVIGTIDGKVSWLKNEGTRDGLPIFAMPPNFMLRVPGGDTGPAVVDWNGDGAEDLILGSGDGAVRLALDLRTANHVGSGPSALLVPPLLNRMAGVPPELMRDDRSGSWVPVVDRPHMRTKPTACDWNGDGLLDLLVGDCIWVREPEPNLTPKEKSEKLRMETERRSASNEHSILSARLLDRARYENGIRDHRRAEDMAVEARIQERLRELQEGDPDYQRLSATLEKLEARITILSAANSTHGYVWVYLRLGSSGLK